MYYPSLQLSLFSFSKIITYWSVQYFLGSVAMSCIFLFLWFFFNKRDQTRRSFKRIINKKRQIERVKTRIKKIGGIVCILLNFAHGWTFLQIKMWGINNLNKTFLQSDSHIIIFCFCWHWCLNCNQCAHFPWTAFYIILSTFLST